MRGKRHEGSPVVVLSLGEEFVVKQHEVFQSLQKQTMHRQLNLRLSQDLLRIELLFRRIGSRDHTSSLIAHDNRPTSTITCVDSIQVTPFVQQQKPGQCHPRTIFGGNFDLRPRR